MKIIALFLTLAAVGAGLCGEWCATAVLAWCGCEAWTWNDEDEAIEAEEA